MTDEQRAALRTLQTEIDKAGVKVAELRTQGADFEVEQDAWEVLEAAKWEQMLFLTSLGPKE